MTPCEPPPLRSEPGSNAPGSDAILETPRLVPSMRREPQAHRGSCLKSGERQRPAYSTAPRAGGVRERCGLRVRNADSPVDARALHKPDSYRPPIRFPPHRVRTPRSVGNERWRTDRNRLVVRRRSGCRRAGAGPRVASSPLNCRGQRCLALHLCAYLASQVSSHRRCRAPRPHRACRDKHWPTSTGPRYAARNQRPSR